MHSGMITSEIGLHMTFWFDSVCTIIMINCKYTLGEILGEIKQHCSEGYNETCGMFSYTPYHCSRLPDDAMDNWHSMIIHRAYLLIGLLLATFLNCFFTREYEMSEKTANGACAQYHAYTYQNELTCSERICTIRWIVSDSEYVYTPGTPYITFLKTSHEQDKLKS